MLFPSVLLISKAFMQRFKLSLFIRWKIKKAVFRGLKSDQNANWSLKSSWFVVILQMYDGCQCPLMELCVGLSEKKLHKDRLRSIFFGFLFIVFVNILKILEDYQVSKRAACGFAARWNQCAEPFVCHRLLTLIKTGHDWANKIALRV